MKDILIKDNFHIDLEPKMVLPLIQCYENNSMYMELLNEYEQLKPLVFQCINPKAAICFSFIETEYADILPVHSPVLYSIATLGNEIVELSGDFFSKGEYLKGMLINAMADACLFGMEKDLLAWIKRECIKRKYGVTHRYEAPMNISVNALKVAYDAVDAKINLGVSLTSGYMFDPVKTSCQVFALGENSQVFHLDHDCKECDNVNCSVRIKQPIAVTLVAADGEKVLMCNPGESLLEVMIRNDIYISAVCGGRGTCGKCKVKLLDGRLEITPSDKTYFSSEEVKEGWRLACKAIPESSCKVQVIQESKDNFYVVSDFGKELKTAKRSESEKFAIAIDIGTTTLAISLVDRKNKGLIDTYTAINQQRSLGADVISRMQTSINGRAQELKRIIQNDLVTGIKEILGKNGLSKEKITEIAIAANTTMSHLLMGYDCSGLGVYPFTPVNISLQKYSFHEVFSDLKDTDFKDMDCQVTLLPGISAYVGADIVSGLYYCKFHETDKVNLLVDIGTNGEIGIGNRKKILTTSTAAGPAFEGGNITWGTGSIQGAISNVNLSKNQVTVNTIGDKAPVGICGTGVIETTAELLKAHIIDETGLMSEDYFDQGFPLAKTTEGKNIVFTQKDIRQLQLAKSAIRSGIETLLLRYGTSYDKIDTVFLAGGFGHKLDLDKAVLIGLLPKEFSGRIEVVGNSSLGGAIKYLSEADSDIQLEQIVNFASDLNLANDLAFQDYYIKYMYFTV